MTNPANSEVKNVLPVQAYFNIDGSFNTFIGQGLPFVVSATESIGIIDTLVDGTFYPTFSPVSTGQITNIDITSTKLTWNPSTGVFSAPTFSGYLNGDALHTSNVTGGNASQLLYQISTGQTGFIPNGSTGQFLTSNGSSAPSWSTVATSVNIADQTSSSSTFYPLFYSATSGSTNTVETSSTKLQYIPSSGTLISTIFSGSGASLTNIPNSALTNSSFTLGSTSISLGNTVTTVAGLASVTSTAFVGALTGNADTATLATNATNTAITDNTSSSATWYPTLVSNSTGNLPITTSSSKLSFVPSTGTLTATTFSGAATNLSGGLAGYLPYQTAVNTTTFLAPGTNGYVLTLASGVPTWAASSGGVTTFSAGTTGFTPSSATSGAITLAGTLAIANGGTNATATPTAGAVPYGTGTAYAFTAAGTTGQALLSNGSSAPTWGTPTAGAGGSTTQVQYNSSGVLAGSANMTFNGTALTLANDATISTLTVGKGGGALASNTVFGYQAINAVATGVQNTAIGYQSLTALTSGVNNVSNGYQALKANTTGRDNDAYGFQSLLANQSGQYNVGIGSLTLSSNVSGSNNTALGANAGSANTGSNGVFLGYNTIAGSGSYNTVVGNNASGGSSSGTFNVCIGHYAGNALTSGSNNVIIGKQGATTTTGSNNIYLGYQVTGSAVGVSSEIAIGANAVGLGTNTTVIGTTSTTLTQLYGVTKSTNYTVATLPSASTSGVGARAFVTDALAPVFGATVAGSGAVPTPVYSDGSAWKVG